ncbi:receptor kinase-like protein Xa21 isoform X3 [Aegilops tauschii subsp. strangulata]|uniref:Receptor kinase-like protein Xa21 n=1 Tax=Aegilops tauschii subsp. strangulata TaxID=200361 RepID=A0A453DL48_AEGTS
MSPTPLIIIVLSSILTCSLLGATALHDHGDASTDFQALRCLKIHLSTSAGFLPSWKIDGSLQKFCTWSGVTCSKRQTSRVVALDLESLYLDGQMPPCIANLTLLTRIHLPNNQLRGPIPTELGQLNMLRYLNLSSNNLSGMIPSTLSSCSQFRVIDLGSNSFSGEIPPNLSQCSNMQQLKLDHNRLIGGIPEGLGILRNLSVLHLAGNTLTGQIPLEIGSLVNLGALNISNNQLSGEIPSTLGECVHLESLHMEGNTFHGSIPQPLMNLRGIIVMDLSQNNLSGEIPNFFQSFSSMKLLNLSFNNLEGPVPPGGMFQNGSEVFIQGNKKLCANTPLLELPLCNGVIYKQKMHISKILKIVAITALSLVLLSCFAVAIFKKTKKGKQAAHPSVKELKKFTYADLVKATNGFSLANLVGSGKYGSVYKGRIESEEHHTVAIKVFKLDQLGATTSFLAECEALRNTRHRNLVRVITVCSTSDPIGNEFKALVLEFMVNGDLESWIYPTLINEHHPKRPLCMGSRIAIAVDIAAALDYLHNQCMPPMVHCDLKPSNVLLDDVMGACVGDFGLAKFLHCYSSSSGIDGSTCTSLVGPRGSVGYIAPEYGYGSKISTEGDVYSYGVIILEMLTGKRPTDELFKDGLSLYKFVEDSFPEKIGEILDPRMIIPYYGNRDEEEAGSSSDQENHQIAAGIMGCITALAKLGLLCAAETPKDRPAMQDVYADAITIKEEFSALQG